MDLELMNTQQEPMEKPIRSYFLEVLKIITPNLSKVENYSFVEFSHLFNFLMNTLTARESQVFRMTFGVGYDQSYSLEEIANHMSVTRERIRQILAKALRKLRQPHRLALIENPQI
jgi:RNA polymerase primary sigma factor